ncbi:LuxR family transcriptional regulator [Roseateles flavus]|uniref:LuxR family transcriptional regulator n=1 Tax=Roseateles flavus TaxID=3149041 RepID=A0ABV0GKE0_9BURK
MSWADKLLLEIDAVDCEHALFATVQESAQALGFEYCAYGMLIPVPAMNPKTFMLNSYPATWQQHYARNSYLDIDPTVHAGRRSSQPILWCDDLFVQAPELWNDARDAGLRVGWAKSVLDGQGTGGLLTLARNRGALTAEELVENEFKMRWLACMAHQGFRKILWTRWSVALTGREREVLRWAAYGKTFSETSLIMDIAVATVKFHTRNAAEKLGTINRTAAVAKAVALRLLD